jgi:thioredoxin-related protein
LLDFTGSDWCPPCKALNEKCVLQTGVRRIRQAEPRLRRGGLPNSKKQAQRRATKANDALAKKYDIKGYPTIIVLDSEGKKVGELGYMKDGPTAFIAALNKLKK